MLSIALGILLFLLFNKNYKTIIYSLLITAIIFTTVYFAPFGNDVNKYLLKDSNTLFERRMVLWEPSFEAAKKGNIFGLGYLVSDPKIKTVVGTGSSYFNGIYLREKGNYYLALIEETGLFGFLLFIIPLFYLIYKTLKISKTKEDLILPVALISFSFHSMFEAWTVPLNATMFNYFYMYVGVGIGNITLLKNEKLY